jgi:hypothetical protein
MLPGSSRTSSTLSAAGGAFCLAASAKTRLSEQKKQIKHSIGRSDWARVVLRKSTHRVRWNGGVPSSYLPTKARPRQESISRACRVPRANGRKIVKRWLFSFLPTKLVVTSTPAIEMNADRNVSVALETVGFGNFGFSKFDVDERCIRSTVSALAILRVLGP